MSKAPFSKQLEQLFVARTPLIFAESSEWQRVQGALLTAVNDESIKTGEERRVILKRGKFSPLEAYDYQLEKWTRDHEHLKQKPQGNNILEEIGWLRNTAKFPFCLLLDDMQGVHEEGLGDHADKAIMSVFRYFVRIKTERDKPHFNRKTILVSSAGWNYPPEISHELVTLEMDLPTVEILATTLRETCGPRGFKVAEPQGEIRDHILKAALGLTVMEAEQAFSTAIVQGDGNWSDDSVKIVLKRKREIIQQSGALDYLEADESMDSIGGLDNLKKWLKGRKSHFTDAAQQRGIPKPKGILLTGVPGCGKSLTAKVIGNEWGLPLVRFDLGSVYQGVVGSSERNIRSALRLAEAVSPCVLFIDEIEKGLSGVGGSGNLDSGTSMRVFGTILSWMNDQDSGVFVVATANKLKSLPPELKRKGRFDEIFFVDLPDHPSVVEIFTIHLNRAEPNWRDSDIDIEKLADYTADAWTGAEIEAAVNEALSTAFSDGNRPMTMADLMNYIKNTTPQSESLEKQIAELRLEAKKIGKDASSKRAKQGSSGGGNIYS
jgi:ATP-dependent 26S proteasome regulatory subunit